jgi:hypothetical protein
MKNRENQAQEKRIEDLTLRELDMTYSLVRTGDWPDSEIGRVYKLSETDVRKIFENYVELRKMLEQNQHDERQPQELSPDSTKKPRKRRCDARFATPAERQRAFRARLKVKRNADVDVPSPDPITDLPAPIQEELSVGTVDAS